MSIRVHPWPKTIRVHPCDPWPNKNPCSSVAKKYLVAPESLQKSVFIRVIRGQNKNPCSSVSSVAKIKIPAIRGQMKIRVHPCHPWAT